MTGGLKGLLVEWLRLETAFHDNLPGQGECGDPAHGKALCQFLYDHSETIRTGIESLYAACEEALDEDSGLACADQLRTALAKARGAS